MKPIVKISKIAFISLLSGIMVFIFTNCSNQEKNYGKITVSMTDTPDSITAVLINIKSVDIHYSGRDTSDSADNDTNEVDANIDSKINGNWIKLKTYEGIYNLIDLQNGVEQVIAADELEAGYITQIRLILGEMNTIVIDGDTLALKIPSATNTGIKINFKNEIIPDSKLNVLLDFDLKKSIIIKDSEQHMLIPVLKVKSAGRS